MFEEGKYKGYLVDSGVAQLANEKQTPYLYLAFEIRHDENGDEVEPKIRDVKIYLSDKALPYAEKDLKRLGFNGRYDSPEFDERLSSDGTTLVCQHNESGGNIYENWSIAGLGGGGSEKKPASKNLIRELNSKWKAHNKSTYTELPARQEEATASIDDDIPF
jgi:hypothetical protein